MTDLAWCYYHNCDKHASPTGPPPRINPTWGELTEHADKTAKWRWQNTPPIDKATQVGILTLIDDSDNAEELIQAYKYAELAGMCYWSIKEGTYLWN